MREIDEEELAETLHREFGLPPEETKTYILLVREGTLSAEEVAEKLGSAVSDSEALLGEMVTRGLIIRATGSSSRFTALHPRMTLTNVFKTYEMGVVQSLRDRRATVDRIVNLLTPIFENRER